MYVELHAASAFSFLDGASLPEALVDRAAQLGYPALALLDRDGVYGAPRFHLAARRAGIKAIIGAELTVAIGAAASILRLAARANRPLYDVLTCIRHKTTLERAGRRLTWNAERYLKSPDAMARLFSDMPGAISATRDLADRLTYTMADLGYRFPDYPVPT